MPGHPSQVSGRDGPSVWVHRGLWIRRYCERLFGRDVTEHGSPRLSSEYGWVWQVLLWYLSRICVAMACTCTAFADRFGISKIVRWWLAYYGFCLEQSISTGAIDDNVTKCVSKRSMLSAQAVFPSPSESWIPKIPVEIDCFPGKSRQKNSGKQPYTGSLTRLTNDSKVPIFHRIELYNYGSAKNCDFPADVLRAKTNCDHHKYRLLIILYIPAPLSAVCNAFFRSPGDRGFMQSYEDENVHRFNLKVSNWNSLTA